jgi:hypothetical protein
MQKFETEYILPVSNRISEIKLLGKNTGLVRMQMSIIKTMQ